MSTFLKNGTASVFASGAGLKWSIAMQASVADPDFKHDLDPAGRPRCELLVSFR